MAKDSLAQYRLRRVALGLKQFTVADLSAGSGLNRESIQVFLHRLEKKDSATLTKENLPSSGPGRPIIRYALTDRGLTILAAEIAPIERQFSDTERDEIETGVPETRSVSEQRRPWAARSAERKPLTSGNTEAVSVVSALLRSAEDPCPLLLLGAGASFRSGVPTAAEAVKQMARLVYAERHLGNGRAPERVKPSEWESWLQSFDWFIPGSDRLAENFPLLVERLLVPAEFRKRVLLDLMRPANSLSAGYRILAEMVMRGLIRTVFTTNFDTCLLDAFRERQPHIRHIHEVNRGPNDYAEFNVFGKCQIIWLHGRAEQYSDKNSAGEINALDPSLTSLLRPMLDASPMIVIGYRGAEPSIMEGFFGQDHEGRLDFRNGVYWCVRHGEAPHPNVEALARRLGSNFQFLRIDGFDEFLTDLSRSIEGYDRYPTNSVAAAEFRGGKCFDEKVVEKASLDDLDMDLALSVLREYCQKLGRAPLTRESLLPLMREQGLIEQSSGTDKVTAGAILLFGKHTQSRFPQAVVCVTEAGKKREIYEGNLIAQHRALLQKIESVDVNPILKLKKRRQHSDQTAYPPRVLVELLVNMLVHRDYNVDEPASVEVSPGAEIVFTNPGGLTPKLVRELNVEADGRILLSKSVTDQRNPSLCDIFFGISAMERAGTGLIDVGQLMLESGGCSAFFHSEKEARFRAVLAQPQASAGSRLVARSDVPTGLYVMNVLPFSAVPDRVTIVALNIESSAPLRGVDLSECGTFVRRSNELWSFVPLQVMIKLFEPIADRSLSRSVPRTEIESSPDTKRVISWLLRKHFEYQLEAFEDAGLVLEYGRKHRAYFAANNGGDRTVVWNSSQRRGNKRDVVKQRSEGPRAWFENEGFGYDIVDVGGLWCVRIKPFYMFTGKNGITPLPSFTRASKATRRIKFDRNKNVEADLSFWAAFLGRGAETLNVGDLHVDDLLIDMAFLTVEIPEIGLVKGNGV
jgi:hypothetical protein